jgi:hypothetical protein
MATADNINSKHRWRDESLLHGFGYFGLAEVPYHGGELDGGELRGLELCF